MDQVGLGRTTMTAALLFSASFAALLLGGVGLWVAGPPLLKAAALLVWALGAAIGGIVRQVSEM